MLGYWLIDEEIIVDEYAKKFDDFIDRQAVDYSGAEIDNLDELEARISNSGLISNLSKRVMRFLKKTQDSVVAVDSSSADYKDKFGLIQLAVYVKISEEKNTDFDYAERVLELAIEIIERICRAPFNKEKLKTKKGSDFEKYENLKRKIRNKFLEEYCKFVLKDYSGYVGNVDVSDGRFNGEVPEESIGNKNVDNDGNLIDVLDDEAETVLGEDAETCTFDPEGRLSSSEIYQWIISNFKFDN